MRLISPTGVRVSVSDEKGEVLKAMRWTEETIESPPAPPATSPKPRRKAAAEKS